MSDNDARKHLVPGYSIYLLICIKIGQEMYVLAVGAGRARYKLKDCPKGPINPSHPNWPKMSAFSKTHQSKTTKMMVKMNGLPSDFFYIKYI